ncbi:MAG: DUF4974 domain-containing protein [Chitinophagaceae bacterium]|nr:MAG: DUF4974 domain-containing protein [Chitinophagaceae bacterium]
MHKVFSSFEEVAADVDFQAWFTGSDKEGAARWQLWMAENPQYKALIEEVVHYLNTIRPVEKPVSVKQTEQAHDRLMQSLTDNAAPVVNMRRGKFRWWLSAAAVVVLVLGGMLLWKTSGDERLKIGTAYGQVKQYNLPDGSEVMLNANSKLVMQKWKEGIDREVWIEGEAFFHVKKTSTKNRFIVHAQQMDIIVTGTQFNVVNRDGESNVLLKEGSVTVKTADGRLIKMVPGDYVTISNSLPKIETAPEEKVLAWTQAKLVFENTPMQEAQRIISRHYGVKVTLKEGVAQKTISGTLPNDNLEVLLKALEATADFRIEKREDEIVISDSE